MKPARATDGFTLIEVVLAISIAAGILAVVLLFYRQTESLRGRLLEETARLSGVRLVMERLSRELASARVCGAAGQGLTGGADTLQFVKLDFPAPWGTNQAVSGAAALPLRIVSYSLLQGTNQNAPTGLLRAESPLSGQPVPVLTNWVTSTDTNSTSLRGAPPPAPPGDMAERIQFLRFRYWDGAAWLDSWTASDLPAGIEVSLGVEPLPSDLTPEEYPFEVYRRVIYLPNHSTQRSARSDAFARQEP